MIFHFLDRPCQIIILIQLFSCEMDNVYLLCKDVRRKGESSSTRWYLILSKRGKQQNLSGIIRCTLGLENESDSKLIGCICRNYYNKLETFYSFKIKSLASLSQTSTVNANGSQTEGDKENEENSPSKQSPNKRNCLELFPTSSISGVTQFQSEIPSTLVNSERLTEQSPQNRIPLSSLPQNGVR